MSLLFGWLVLLVVVLLGPLSCDGWSQGDVVPLFLQFRVGDDGPPTALQSISANYGPLFGIDRVVDIPHEKVKSTMKEVIVNASRSTAHLKVRADLGVVRRRTPWITMRAPSVATDPVTGVSSRTPHPYLAELILRFQVRGVDSTFGDILEVGYSARYSEHRPSSLVIRYEWVQQHTLLPQAGVVVTLIAAFLLIAVSALYVTADMARSPLAKVLVVKDRDD